MRSLAIVASGMVTGVGLNSPASCAAIRCALDNFNETRFMDEGGEWIIGSEVPFDRPRRGYEKLVEMGISAVKECLAHAGKTRHSEIPLLLCVAEPDRAGRLPGLDDTYLKRVEKGLGTKFHPRSAVISRGRVSIAEALHVASHLIEQGNCPFCIIAGVDSFLHWPTLSFYESRMRLLTSRNSNGFIPGEGAAAILVGRNEAPANLLCVGIGAGLEPSTINAEEPLRADGLVQAFKSALTDANCTLAEVDYRLADVNGEQYGFKEAALAMTRTLRERKELFDIWHPADCIGETGAAIGPLILGVALSAAQKGYAPGAGALCHFSADAGDRAAVILRYGQVRSS